MDSRVSIGVDFIAPVMIRAAQFWTFPIFENWDSDAVAHAADPYSRTGLIIPV